jgi:hypothetical protein
VIIDVVEGMLGDITNDQVRVLPDFTPLVGLHIANQELDESRFTGTVGAKDSDTGRKRNLQSNVVELLLGLGRVLEADLTHLEQTLFLGLDTLEEGRIGKLELVILCSLESVIRLGFGDVLDKLIEVSTVAAELEAVEVQHVSDCVVEEGRIVGDDD